MNRRKLIPILAIAAVTCVAGTKEKPAPVTEEEAQAAYSRAVPAITAGLKTPSTAKFQPVGEITVQGIRDRLDRDLLKFQIWVDAQNKYGAMVRAKFNCSLSRYGPDKKGREVTSCLPTFRSALWLEGW